MYQLTPLPYLYQDLEPFIDTHTMGIHYHKHQQTYLNNLNNILKKDGYDYRYNMIELLYHVNEFPQDDRENILFNLGGVINHDLYWKSMNSKSYLPTGRLDTQIIKQYGNYDNFWKKIKETALKLKGSGYTFIVLTNDGTLDIMNFSNQDTPILHGLVPLFTIDLWEHAYYINYENDKGKYLDNFRKISDFRNASHIYNNIRF